MFGCAVRPVKSQDHFSVTIRLVVDPVEGDCPTLKSIGGGLGINQRPEKVPGLALILRIVNFDIKWKEVVTIADMFACFEVTVKRKVVTQRRLMFDIFMPEIEGKDDFEAIVIAD